MKFKDFKSEVAEMFNCNIGTLAIKYFLPGNKKTLISISNDKDLRDMIKFHNDSDTAEMYVMTEEISVPDVSQMPGSRSSRTTFSEAEVPVDASASMVDNIKSDIDKPGLLLDPAFDVVGDTNHNEGQTDVLTVMPLPVSSLLRLMKSIPKLPSGGRTTSLVLAKGSTVCMSSVRP